MFYMLMPTLDQRQALIQHLAERSILSVFHYVPLHNSPAGKRYGRTVGEMQHTDNLSDRLLRLPLWVGMDEAQDFVIEQLQAAI